MLQSIILGFKSKFHAILSSSGFRKYFSNTSWLLGEKLFSMAFAFLIGAWVTRHLGPEGRGFLSYGKSFAAFFVTFANLGLSSILTRDLVGSSSKDKHKTLGTAFVIRLVAAGVTFLVLLLSLWLWPQNERASIIILILGTGMVFKAVYILFETHLDALVKAKYHVQIKLFITFATGAMKVGAILSDLDVVWFAVILLSAEVISFVGFGWVYLRQVGQIRSWRFDWGYVLSLLKDSWPNLLNGFVVVVYIQADQIMITNMLGPEENGIYAVSLQLLSVWYFLPGLLVRSLFPAIQDAFNKDKALFKTRLQVLMDVSLIMAVGIGASMYLFGEFIILNLFGEEFARAVPVLRINIWALIFLFVNAAGGSWLLSNNLQRISFYRTILGLIINVSLNYLLIPRIGIEGAAIATVTAQLVASYLGYGISPKTREVFWMQTKAFFGISIYQNLKNREYQKVLLNK